MERLAPALEGNECSHSTSSSVAHDPIVRPTRSHPGPLACPRAPGFNVEVLDLRDWPLPFFAETCATIGDFANPTYHDPIVKRWNTKIGEGDAYLFITPEYNHSIPGVLKNAIDSVFGATRCATSPLRSSAIAWVWRPACVLWNIWRRLQ